MLYALRVLEALGKPRADLASALQQGVYAGRAEVQRELAGERFKILRARAARHAEASMG